MKKVIILHAWYSKPTDNWYPWLKTTLQDRGFEVFVPTLPTSETDAPQLTPMLEAVEKLSIDADTMIIGHSIGALVAMRLAEKHSFDTLITVAGWDFDDLFPPHAGMWPKAMNHKAIIEHTNQRFCIASDNDLYFTAYTNNEMSKRLQAQSIIIPDKKHFEAESGTIELPELLSLI